MSRRVRAALAAALLLAVPAVAGCEEAAGPPGAARVDVDTPELRALKAEAGVADCQPVAGDPVAGGLPDVTLPCLGGGPDVGLAALRGPLVVNFWAVWCGPCREEMPVLEDFHRRHGDRVAVLGIDYNDPQVERAMELVVETGVTYPLLADPQELVGGSGALPLRGLPLTVLVDEDGQVAHVESGEVASVRELAGLVRSHLGVEL